MGTIVNIDGNLLSPEDAHVSVFDHGFLFGDSVYEVVRTHCGVLFALEEHLERLRLSAEAIKLAVEADDLEVADEILRTVEAGGNTESYVRLIISRGTGEIDIHPASCKRPRMIIIAQPYRPLDGSYYTRGAEVALVSIERTSQASLNPSIKSGNYLNNILAIMEARSSGALEAVMLNSRGFIAECTTSNIFLVKDGKVLTPSLGAGILSGITRRFVIRVARDAGMAIEETDLSTDDLSNADEVFITSTLKNIVPVTRVSGSAVGGGSPGPVTRKLMERYRRFMDARVVKGDG